MGITVTLTDLDNLTNQTSAVAAINSNSDAITTGFTDAVNIEGDTIQGNLDMNSNQILNLPVPATPYSPARLIDVVSTPVISSVPPVGTSGAVVGLLNANKTDSGNNTFSGKNTFYSPAINFGTGSDHR